jgi:hypothetical protein
MGERRAEHAPNLEDRTSFLRAHIHALETLPHSLDQVTVVVAQGGDPVAEEFAKGLTKISGVAVKVLLRPNTGMSYAGWNLAHDTFGDAFTHYIVVEDDYVPCQPNFDAFLVDIAEQRETFVCGLTEDTRTLAVISNGVVPERIWRHVAFPPFRQNADCQVVWSNAFHASGYPIAEYLEFYSAPFWSCTRHEPGVVRWYGHPSRSPLFVPVQALDGWSPLLGARSPVSVQFQDGNASVRPPEAWEDMKATPLDDPFWRWHPRR